MIPSPVPKQLQELTQFEEMLIARAFPVMHVYTKPRGGQKAYKGHVITLPQDVQQLADVLPRCPKDLPAIVFTVSGKHNNSKDFIVRWEKVAQALFWLTDSNASGEPNNHVYQHVKIDKSVLDMLPENGMPNDIATVEIESEQTKSLEIDDLGPVNPNTTDKVYDEHSEISSFLPTKLILIGKRRKMLLMTNFLTTPKSMNGR